MGSRFAWAAQLFSNHRFALRRWAESLFFLAINVAKTHYFAIALNYGPCRKNNLIALATLLGFICLLRGRWKTAASAFCSAAISLTLLADLLYLRALNVTPEVGALEGASQLVNYLSSIPTYLHGADWLIWADLPVWLFLLFCRQHEPGTPLRFGRQVLVATLLATVLGVNINATWKKSVTDGMSVIENRAVLIRLGPISYHVWDLSKWTAQYFQRRSMGEADLAGLATTVPPPIRSSDVLLPFGHCTAKDVLTIQVESLEAWVIDYRVAGIEVTPHLNQLAHSGLLWTRFYSQASSGRTSDAEFIALNSLLPYPSAPTVFRFAHNDLVSVPRVLREQGYSTICISQDLPETWNFAAAQKTYGFEHVVGNRDFANSSDEYAAIDDLELCARASDIITQLKPPFFTYLITGTSHSPYIFPKRLQSIPLDKTITASARNYINTIHYADRAIGELVAVLKRHSLFDHTILIIFGDHTSLEPKDRASLGLNPIGAENDLWSQTRQVPLIMVGGGLPTRREETPAGQIDLAPTLLHLLGVDPSKMVLLGENLFDRQRLGRVCFADGEWLNPQARLVTGANGPELQHLNAASAPPSQDTEITDWARRQVYVSSRILDGNLAAKLQAMRGSK